MFNKARDENGQQAEAEKKKLEKEALKEQAGTNSSARKEVDSDRFAEIRNKLHSYGQLVCLGMQPAALQPHLIQSCSVIDM
ncbi:unnamed protein product [Ilex paraguariensis]|uniref:Uncharacterized protein n=1 Tax=Ilex paraguariensis TaxID=185542 RepID=A0ABC8RCW9_9AQUA